MTRSRKIFVAVALLLMAAVALLTACNHQAKGFLLQLSFDGNKGSVTASAPQNGESYAEGESVTVTVQAKTGYQVATFAVSGHPDAKLTDGTCTFAMDADVTVTVTFEDAPPSGPAIPDSPPQTSFTVSTTVTPQQGGSVSISPVKQTYSKGDYITVTVTPQPHYAVAKVLLNGAEITLSGNLSYTLEVDKDINIEVQLRLQYVVTVDADEGVDVKLTPESDGNVYAPDTQLGVQVTVQQGYRLVSVKCNGADQTLTDNAFSLTLTDDVTISARAQRLMPADYLASARGSALFEGVRVDSNYEEGDDIPMESDTTDMSTLFDATHNAVWLNSVYFGANVNNVLLSKANDGTAQQVLRNPDGTVLYQKPLDDEGNPVNEQFSARFNPFDVLTESDFDYVGNDVWQLTDLTKARAAAYALTGMDAPIQTFEIIGKDAVAQVHIVTEIYHTSFVVMGAEFEYYTNHDYTFDIKQHGTASLPAERFAPYTLSTQHQALSDALAAAVDSDSYRVNVRRSIGTDAQSCNAIVSGDVVWMGNVPWMEEEPPFGYFRREDGNAWRFVNETGGGLLVGDELGYSWQQFAMRFVDSELSLALFEAKGNGVYALRSWDAAQITDGENTLGGAMANLFALDEEQHELFPLAHSLQLTVSDGHLSKVEVSFLTYELTFELTFDQWGSASLPTNVRPILNSVNGAVSHNYVGSWIEQGTHNRLEITLDSVRINNRRADDITAASDGYTMSLDGTAYTMKLDGDDLLLTYGGSTHTYRRQLCAWEMYFGQYSAWGADGTEYTLTIDVNGVSWTDGKQTYTPFEVQFGYNETLGSDVFSMSIWQEESDEQPQLVSVFLVQMSDSFDLLHLRGNDDSLDLLFRTATYQPNLTDFAGVYVGEQVTVAIDAHSVTLTANGDTQVGQHTDIAVYINAAQYRFVEISFWIGQQKYVLQGITTINLGRFELYRNNQFMGFVRIADFVPDWSMFCGTFRGSLNGTAYKAEITPKGVTLTVGDNSAPVTDLQFDFDSQLGQLVFRFTFDGKPYTLQQADSVYARLRLVGNNIAVTLTKDGFAFDLSYFVGVYEGTADNSPVVYRVVVTENGLTLAIGNAAPVQAEIVDVQQGENPQIIFTVEGKTYYLMDYYGSLEDQGALYLMDDGNLSAELKRKAS